MNVRKLLLIPLLPLLLAGCVNDDREECITEENAELVFEYTGALAAEFSDLIRQVDVIVFDEAGRYLLHESAGEAELDRFRGMRLTLPEGTYYVVAWANVRDNSAYNSFVAGVTPWEDCLLEIKPSCTESGDPVFYAPKEGRTKAAHTRAGALSAYEVEIPYGVRVVKKLDFARAHRTINVWVKDFADPANLPPTIEAGKLWSRYDFYCKPTPERRDYVQLSRAATLNGATYTQATFHSALGEITGDTDIAIRRTSDGVVRQTVNLKQFIANNGITETDEIDMLVTFIHDLGAVITVPDWEEAPITPGQE